MIIFARRVVTDIWAIIFKEDEIHVFYEYEKKYAR